MKRFLPLIALILLCPAMASAAEPPIMDNGISFPTAQPIPDPNNPGEFLPYAPPVEPNIEKVTFLKQEPTSSLRERVDRLLYGIKIDIPPEYDVYGYELRRYMAHINNPEVFINAQRLDQELKNIKNAKIVHKFWRQEWMNEISALEKDIEAQKPSSDVKTSFKFNSGVSMAFMSECAGWIDAQEKMLKFLKEKQGAYSFKDGTFEFMSGKDRRTFILLWTKAHEAKTYINGYLPFGAMAY